MHYKIFSPDTFYVTLTLFLQLWTCYPLPEYQVFELHCITFLNNLLVLAHQVKLLVSKWFKGNHILGSLHLISIVELFRSLESFAFHTLRVFFFNWRKTLLIQGHFMTHPVRGKPRKHDPTCKNHVYLKSFNHRLEVARWLIIYINLWKRQFLQPWY